MVNSASKKGLHTLCVVILILSVCGFSSFCFAFGLKDDWNRYPSEHFLISYPQGIPNKYIRDFTGKCERYYRLIRQRLGLSPRREHGNIYL
jgi:hypothetical protein